MREIRKDAGLTGRALAIATGQHFTRVSKIENGAQAPTDQDIRDWCRACAAGAQVPDLIATARAVESAYLEFRRQARAGMKRVTGAHTLPLYERTGVFRIYEIRMTTTISSRTKARDWLNCSTMKRSSIGRCTSFLDQVLVVGHSDFGKRWQEVCRAARRTCR